MKINQYEAMFLLDNNAATADFDATAGQVDAILEKHGASIVQKEKWDERKLAYEIKGHRRATYYLVYFTSPTNAIDKINEDVALNEVILRHLTIALDEPIEEHIEKRAKERELLAEDSRKNSLGGWGDRRDRRSSRKPGGEKPAADKPAEGKTDDDKPAEGKADDKPAAKDADAAPEAETPVAEAETKSEDVKEEAAPKS